MEEKWKDIPGYEGLYQVSNLANVKSLKRTAWNGHGIHILKQRILKPGINSKGYYIVVLYKNKGKSHKLAELVAITFLGHKPGGYNKVVDHIDNNRLNDRIDNLQLISHRENISKDTWRRKNISSKYVGVSWHKRIKKWASNIKINGKQKSLGFFTNELDASMAYQKALSKL